MIASLAAAASSPLAQAVAIILGTFVLEDAATVLAAMRVSDGGLSMRVALVALYIGVVLGDVGLYGLGRLSARIGWIARLIPPERSRAVGAWMRGHVFKIVLISRFLPGMRLPAYTACGFLQTDFRRFTLAAIAATLIWTSLLFGVSLRAGALLMQHLGAWRWAGAAGFTLALLAIGHLARRLPGMAR